jgi:hypothetical protein
MLKLFHKLFSREPQLTLNHAYFGRLLFIRGTSPASHYWIVKYWESPEFIDLWDEFLTGPGALTPPIRVPIPSAQLKGVEAAPARATPPSAINRPARHCDRCHHHQQGRDGRYHPTPVDKIPLAGAGSQATSTRVPPLLVLVEFFPTVMGAAVAANDLYDEVCRTFQICVSETVEVLASDEEDIRFAPGQVWSDFHLKRRGKQNPDLMRIDKEIN